MSLPYSPPKWADGKYAVPVPCGLPEFSAPISTVNTEYLLRQKWQVLRNAFSSLALSTAHPDYSSFVLVAEGPRVEVGPGLVEWERLYAAVPASHDVWQSFPYTFTGLVQQAGPSTLTRPPKLWKVTTRVQHDYFLLGVSQTDPITGNTYTPAVAGDINKIYAQQYVIQATVGGYTYGGVTLAADYLAPSAAVTNPSWPTSEQYLGMVSDALTNGWGARKANIVIFPSNTASHNAGVINTGSSVIGGQIPVEDSQLDQWFGNIYVRRTRYGLAQ